MPGFRSEGAAVVTGVEVTNCPVPMTAWSLAFLLPTSLVFCVDYTRSLPSVRQREMQDVWVSA